MKQIAVVLSFCLLFLSCNNGKKSKQRIVPSSSGKLNHLSVVIENASWKSDIGESIRDIFGAPVDALPQDEPLFSMNQIPPHVFSGFVTRNRLVLKVEKGKPKAINFAQNSFARPQCVVTVSGMNSIEIKNELKTNADKIIELFKNTEIKERQRQISKSLFQNSPIKDSLGLSIQFPTAYRIAKNENNFFWLRKDITTGSTNIMLYELPYSAIQKNDSLVNRIISIRDSIGKVYIPGRLEGAYMITEKAFSPFVNETVLDNKTAIETKGIWEVKNDFMAGPFINYLIDDKKNNRWVVVEGFAFAPSVDKREYMLELEAIIKSLAIN